MRNFGLQPISSAKVPFFFAHLYTCEVNTQSLLSPSHCAVFLVTRAQAKQLSSMSCWVIRQHRQARFTPGRSSKSLKCIGWGGLIRPLLPSDPPPPPPDFKQCLKLHPMLTCFRGQTVTPKRWKTWTIFCWGFSYSHAESKLRSSYDVLIRTRIKKGNNKKGNKQRFWGRVNLRSLNGMSESYSFSLFRYWSWGHLGGRCAFESVPGTLLRHVFEQVC